MPPSDFFPSRSFSHDVKVLEFYLIFVSLAQSIFASLKVFFLKLKKAATKKKARTRCCNNFLIDPFHLSMSIHRFECKFFLLFVFQLICFATHTWRNICFFWTFLSLFLTPLSSVSHDDDDDESISDANYFQLRNAFNEQPLLVLIYIFLPIN